MGHLVEYIQTDIFVRFLRLTGRDVVYCCADDTHGTPIELKANELGIEPEQLIAQIFKEHTRDFKNFLIKFDNYYSTNSKENKHFSDLIFNRLKENGHIYTKEIEVTYCEHDKRTLPDRYVRGRCPKCGAEDQYGDVCEKCNAAYKTIDLVGPYCILCKKTPIKKSSKHYFFKLSSFSKFLEKWIKENKNLQPEIKNFVLNWIKDGLDDWDISRDGPYFGFKIPGEKDKYYYVWLDAPIGYIASFANYTGDIKKAEERWNDSEIIHFIGKDITYFHLLFWPAMLHGSGFNLPKGIVVHGFLTVNGEKMSKSRGTFLTAGEFLEKYDAEHLRYYYGNVLSKKLADIDLNFDEFRERINNELVGNLGNFCYRIISFINKNFNGEIKGIDDSKEIINAVNKKVDIIRKRYEELNFNFAVNETLLVSDIGNKYFQESQPWKLIKEDREKVQKICGLCINIAKNLGILIQPVLPRFSEELQKQLNLKDLGWDDIGFGLKNHKIGREKILVEKIEKIKDLDISSKPIRKVQYSIDPEVKDLGINVCFAQINNIKVKKKHEGLEKIKKQIAGRIKELSQEELNNNKVINGYKELYKKVGAENISPGFEYLLKLTREKGKLPTINNVVDSYNIVSVSKFLNAGCHDVNKIDGNVKLKITNGNERFVPLGSGATEKVNRSEFAFADEKEILCRLDAKQSEKSKVDEKTQSALLYFQGNKNVKKGYLRNAVEEACKNIVKFCGGSYEILNEKTSEELFPLNLKVAKIIDVKDHPDADKLYVLQIDLGKEKRQLVAGLKGYYSKDELKNKKIIVVANLKYAKLRGVESQGMLLAGDDGKDVGVLTIESAKPGTQAGIEGLENSPEQISFEQFQKLNIVVKNNKPYFSNKEIKAGSESIKAEKVKDGARIR